MEREIINRINCAILSNPKNTPDFTYYFAEKDLEISRAGWFLLGNFEFYIYFCCEEIDYSSHIETTKFYYEVV